MLRAEPPFVMFAPHSRRCDFCHREEDVIVAARKLKDSLGCFVGLVLGPCLELIPICMLPSVDLCLKIRVVP